MTTRRSRRVWSLIPFAAVSAVHVGAKILGAPRVARATKVALLPLLALRLVAGPHPDRRTASLLAASLTAGWIGDVTIDRSLRTGLWESTGAEQVLMSPELVAELGEKDEPSELLAVVEMPPDDLSRLDPAGLTVVFDRPTQPGNLGTLSRSADAFGASALVVTGHAADPYDPRAVRSSTGSLFALTVVRAPSHREVLDWSRPHGIRVVGTDETGSVDVRDADLTGPLIVVVGNETNGMTAAWREACDVLVSIPMAGSASSLNAATAGSIVLEEAYRQRRG